LKLKIAVIFVILLALLLPGCKYVEGLLETLTPTTTIPATTTQTTTTPKPTTTTITTTYETTTASGGLVVVSKEMTIDARGRQAVKLLLRNDGSVKIDLIKVTVRFLDSHKALVDSSIDSMVNLLAGATTDLVIPCLGTCENVTGYEINIETTIY
jgi:hypothetical protein